MKTDQCQLSQNLLGEGNNNHYILMKWQKSIIYQAQIVSLD